MTSMGSGSSANRIFHNGTIEISSSLDLMPGVSRAPIRLERSDKMEHTHILDHGEHSRHAIQPPPRKKHPSSQKRMNMTLLHRHSMDKLHAREDSVLQANAGSLFSSMPDLSTWRPKDLETSSQQISSSSSTSSSSSSDVTISQNSLEIIRDGQEQIIVLKDDGESSYIVKFKGQNYIGNFLTLTLYGNDD